MGGWMFWLGRRWSRWVWRSCLVVGVRVFVDLGEGGKRFPPPISRKRGFDGRVFLGVASGWFVMNS